ncbi:hypothetical protein HN014_01595 [Aquimarina sp. TRL1]|uniref:hypothetical protein n=1 Tax=Aquimarina sp. (strain TRL1) TaxID=2736252 RepID=UPI00158B2B88|nr:hypothetical protein [Aquimarina sp. TRL1]QKX03660.1 hypothetical protein HN014_01595 [Aquimarina sp. TRL1]
MERLIMSTKYIFLGLIWTCSFVSAQVSIDRATVNMDQFTIRESPKLITNDKVLLTGEKLLYKIFSMSNPVRKKVVSTIGYVSLRNESDSIVFQHRLKLKDGKSVGAYFIPGTLKTGKYHLIAYTNFSLNNTKAPYAKSPIYLINPFKKTPLIMDKEEKGITEVKTSIERDTISVKRKYDEVAGLETDKKVYKPREKVKLIFKNMNKVNKSSVLSVRKVAPINVYSEEEINEPFNNEQTNFFVPEIRGEIISGYIQTSRPDKSIKDKVISLTISGDNTIFKLAKTNSKGHFFFVVPEDYTKANSIFQVHEEDRDDYSLEVNTVVFRQKKEDKKTPVILDATIKNWLEKRSIQLQIENAYYDTKKTIAEKKKETTPFFELQGKNYVLSEYNHFPTMKEVFVEIIENVGIRKRKEGEKFVMITTGTDKDRSLFSKMDPLILIDGVLIQNAKELVDYDPKKVESIRIVNESYRYGPKIYSGIIAVSTKKGDFKPILNGEYIKEVELQGITPYKKIYTPDYTDKKLDRIPDYRVQLFWDPEFILDSESKTVNFYTSDVPGKYEIKLSGYTNDGVYINSTNYFIVE